MKHAAKSLSLKQTSRLPPKDTDWAYLAGFFDGEGCVTACRQSRKGRPYFALRFIISNTDLSLLQNLQLLFGGSIHVLSKPKKLHWKQVYMWHMESRDACLYVLKGMRQYLKYKATEADIAIEWFETLSSPNKGTALSNEETVRRAVLVQRLRSIPGRRTGAGTILIDLPSCIVDFKRICGYCRGEFEKTTGATVYCSDSCRRAARQSQYDAWNQSRRSARAKGTTAC